MLRWWEPPTPGLLEFVGTWGVVCWLNHHYHRPYQADAWSTAPDRFWVGTSLNHLASSFQDTIHILCGSPYFFMQLSWHFNLVHLQTKPFSAHFLLVTYWKELPVSRHGLKNWLPKRRLKSRLPRRTAARRTPALEAYFSIAAGGWSWIQSKFEGFLLRTIFFFTEAGWSCSTLPKLYGTVQWKRWVTFHECFLSSLWVCS